jgi:hypothetical protein
MRGLLPEERDVMQNQLRVTPCNGQPRETRRYWDLSDQRVMIRLVKQERIAIVACGCGGKHFRITAQGHQALYLDKVVNSQVSL